MFWCWNVVRRSFSQPIESKEAKSSTGKTFSVRNLTAKIKIMFLKFCRFYDSAGDSCEFDILGKPWGNSVKFGTNIHWRMNCLELVGRRSNVTVTSQIMFLPITPPGQRSSPQSTVAGCHPGLQVWTCTIPARFSLHYQTTISSPRWRGNSVVSILTVMMMFSLQNVVHNQISAGLWREGEYGRQRLSLKPPL